jgi:hypothetical protein
MKEVAMRLQTFLAATLLAGLSSQPLFAADVGIGRVKLASGLAVIERGGQKIPATLGQLLYKGDTLTTGKNGRIGVTFNDNTRFAAGPNSRIAVQDFAFNDTTHQGKFVTQVDKGSLAVVSGQIAKSEKDAMKVRTPTALLGVRGTRFVVQVN